MEFHISREARDRYSFDRSLFTLTGNVILADFHATRVFAHKINQTRDLVRFPEQAVKAGQINAMGLIDEILHYVVGLYRRQRNPDLMQAALTWLEERLDPEAVETTLRRFVDQFPPVKVYQQQISPEEYLQAETDGVPNRQVVLEEMMMLWLANVNPAFSPFLDLFDDSLLEKETSYVQVMSLLDEFLNTRPTFGPDNQTLIDLLRSPAVVVPHSLSGQLDYIRQKWGMWLDRYLYRLLGSLDLIKEEEKAVFLGPGPAVVYDYGGLEVESERFSPDRDWMPNLVLMAKNTYVWLDQLSNKYGQPISGLDQVPDRELDELARWGFTGLWLIGLWERSQASRTIKQLCGNPEAAASAYSLYDYQIAGDLGGEDALQNLKQRAWQRGIRLASDMVPNHMAIDSKWMIEHPDWFLSLDYSPFASYTFNGPDLSWDDRVGIFIEDHYYNRTDAAVVCKRVDRWTGSTQFIYHGNDGTSMPWNDTAQLNYLNPEVREAVIQTILNVARRFSVIRFDAAMTLTKRHYQRLWFPEPGHGGDIPTRAEHGMTRSEFNQLMPEEFWREVVDRVAQEVPDTLLLAEAFWLMEGYFVRTLGMHRVYNSAFMNMLRDEENANYRSVIKNTLEFDPEILKRFVNFMNNPDERTAVDQFGKDDKYFGVCILMATMPGLPMFGHGQIEGFTEKYGMEYRRAYWNEQPDQYLVERHQREVFPLLRRRYLFADVQNFLLYDFFTPEGYVNEDVFAYSNLAGEERSLVVYHNRFASARGWIRSSVAYSVKTGYGDAKRLESKNLGQGLKLSSNDGRFCIFRDSVSNLEYIRSNKELLDKGLYVELDAYKYHVFLDFREVEHSQQRPYAFLMDYLNGRGVPSIEEALTELLLQPIHQAFNALVGVDMVRRLMDERITASTPDRRLDSALLADVNKRTGAFLQQAAGFAAVETYGANVLAFIEQELEIALRLAALPSGLLSFAPGPFEVAALYGQPDPGKNPSFWNCLIAWLYVHRLGQLVDETDFSVRSRSLMDEWLLGKIIAGVLRQQADVGDAEAWRMVTLIKILVSHQAWYNQAADVASVGSPIRSGEPTTTNQVGVQSSPVQVLHRLLGDSETQRFLHVNRHQDVLWFNKESFEELLWWLYVVAVVQIGAIATDQDNGADDVAECYRILTRLLEAGQDSNYRVETLLDLVESAARTDSAD